MHARRTRAGERMTTDTDRERIIDARVWRILATDRAYLHAESAEAQAAREDAVTRMVEDAYDRDAAHARALRRAYHADDASTTEG